MKRVTFYAWLSAAIALIFALGVASALLLQPPPRPLTQKDIDSAVLHTLHTKTLPSQTARAAEVIRESVVEVRSFSAVQEAIEKAADGAPAPPAPPAARRDRHPPAKPPDSRQSGPAKDAQANAELAEARHIGSGVVVTESGMVITSHHVVAGAHRLEVRFHDGHTAQAVMVQAIPERDLAILQPASIPDDLPPATLGSSRDLAPGADVVAVGFPFGIGPSVSAGVVSGLDRQFVSPDTRESLDRLIQFDAAVNPGNSGGPLINMNGEVVGIVTAILNPSQSGTFVGIGFATTIESVGGSLGFSPF
ncbi:S1C family serine protease [Cupriavidus sp. AU9028]|uniref:S1C family serine protease n=1 Tax=Cupriavidus sp. AU9028 TaxID=2871157 RepID=UPI001C956D6B|nr:trypsin-like peptidase domain-containing protein [Cupriavidus sp. AU9028]MBY4899139.1 trypsin-like peptidase domain-containing protein [Cupriavidus sp. AU9028]